MKMLKRRSDSGTAPANHYRFELEFESEELRQKWIASDGHQRVWPLVEKHHHPENLSGGSYDEAKCTRCCFALCPYACNCYRIGLSPTNEIDTHIAIAKTAAGQTTVALS